MRVLVIGSEGNVGKPLAEYLYTSGYDVVRADIEPGWKKNYSMADINAPIDLLDAFDTRPDIVLLLAAVVSRVTCEEAAGLAVQTNIAGTNNIIQLCKRVGAKLVYFSTSEVYGPTNGVMDERVTVCHPNNRYGLTKLIGEQLVEYEVRTHSLKAVILRPFMFYDENEELGDHRSAIIRFASNLSAGEPIYVHRNTGRGWLHMDDAVDAITTAMHVDNFTTINIGHHEFTLTIDLAEMIRLRLGAPLELIRTINIPDMMSPFKHPSLYRQREILGFQPSIGIEEGIERVCARFKPCA
jgi:nucleoside-diphosphate-sugar epimerase